MSFFKKLGLVICDLVLLYGALCVTLFIRYPRPFFLESLRAHIGPFTAVFAVWIFVFYLADLYRQKPFRTRGTLVNTLLIAAAVSMLASIVLFYLAGSFFRLTPKTNLLIFATVFVFADYFVRNIIRILIMAGGTPVALLGTSPRMDELAEHFKENPHSGYRLALRDPDLSGAQRELQDAIRESGSRIVVVHPDSARRTGALPAIYGLLPEDVALSDAASFYEFIFGRIPLDELEEGWFISHIAGRRPLYDAAKRLVDFLASLALAVVLSPVFLVIAAAIAATSRGSVIFRQERVGRQGKTFMLYKFRTMRARAESGTWPSWTERNDPRITGIGKFLRFTHLDEIPQLWNIVKGDISFTGPRPESADLAAQYRALPYYEIRHLVKPGLTGWAQINYRPSASLEEARIKLEYDIFYVKNRSFVLDTLIAIRTLRYFFVSHAET